MSAGSSPAARGGGEAAHSDAGTPRGVPPLGTNTGIVGRSIPLSALAKRVLRRESRIERYQLQAVARQILPKERIRFCFRNASPASSPHLKYSPLRKTAHLSGLMVCGSPWSCAVCASRIAERRRAEVAQAITWARAEGLQVVLSTFTLRHSATDSLEASLAALMGAYRRMQQRRDYKALRASYGLSHTIKAAEVTWSLANGFHPHLHGLHFLAAGLDVTAYHRHLTLAWLPSLTAEGFSATAAHGVDVKATWGDVEQYVTKFGRTWGAADELTRANTKRGRKDSLTPWDLLRSVAETGDQQHANRFREFALTMKGKHQVQWSRGFKGLVGIEDRSDEDLAANFLDDDQAAYWFAGFDPTDWAAIRFCGPEAKADLEAAGDVLDRERVAQLVAGYRARYFAEGWGL